MLSPRALMGHNKEIYFSKKIHKKQSKRKGPLKLCGPLQVCISKNSVNKHCLVTDEGRYKYKQKLLFPFIFYFKKVCQFICKVGMIPSTRQNAANASSDISLSLRSCPNHLNVFFGISLTDHC